MSDRKLIQRLFTDHAGALQVFFRRRIRQRRDALDLTQEVYLRLLRAADTRTIHNPEAYLFTVANNLVREQHVMQRRETRRVELSDAAVEERMTAESMTAGLDAGYDPDRAAYVRCLRRVLPELPARTQHALVMSFDEDLSHKQIAERLGISKTMVHKILTQAISYCRRRMFELEGL
jgi:RNA polymerase sigma factor (sigma-70 family)